MAAGVESNRSFRADGLRLNFWRSVISAAMLLPAIPFMTWPMPSPFYAAALMRGVIIMVGLMVMFDLAAKHSGRVASLHQPVNMLTGFFVWLLVEPTAFGALIADPIKATGIIAALGGMMLAIQFLRQNDSSWQAFLKVAPVGVMFAIGIGVFGKYTMQDAPNVASLLLTYVFISEVLTAVLAAGVIASRGQFNKRDLRPPKMFVAATCSAAFFLGNDICTLLGIVLAPNPSYAIVIKMLCPVWIMVWHSMKGHKDDANPLVGFTMMGSAMLLAFCAV